MSLAALNQPGLIAGLGIGLHVALPYVGELNLPFKTLRWINFVTFGMNMVSVSMPGRIDGEQAKELSNPSYNVDESAKALSPKVGKTLVAPSGWAFAIWGPIFMGELALVLAQFTLDPATLSPLASMIQRLSLPFSAAQLFQCLWCASFRPKYEGSLMYISTAMLSSIAWSLSQAHAVTSSSSFTSLVEYLLYGWPVAMHFGWTTAASLVNLNGAVAKQASYATPKVMAGVGHASAVAATGLGVYLTVTRSAPVYGGVIAWALTAVADSITKRLAAAAEAQETKKSDDSDSKELFGAKPQQYLSYGGAILCAATSLVVALQQQQGAAIKA